MGVVFLFGFIIFLLLSVKVEKTVFVLPKYLGVHLILDFIFIILILGVVYSFNFRIVVEVIFYEPEVTLRVVIIIALWRRWQVLAVGRVD